MDWKELMQFALTGSRDLEQYAILLVRISIGLFFAISGANKLFVAGDMKDIYETLVKSKVPFPRQTAYFVSTVEFVGGSMVAVGFLSSAACAALLIDMTVDAAQRTFAAQLVRRFPLPSGSLICALLCLADLLWPGTVQCRLLARAEPTGLIE